MFRDILAGLFGSLGAAVFSQGPEFMQQYLQRLGGHLDEARRLQEQVPALVSRVATLQESHDAIAAATPLGRPFQFLHHLDPDIAMGTFGVYRPAVPLTAEGLIYAGSGLLLGIALFNLLRLPFRHRARAPQDRAAW